MLDSRRFFLLIAVFTLNSTIVLANDLPKRKSGLWHITGIPFTNFKLCVDRSEDDVIETDIWSSHKDECVLDKLNPQKNAATLTCAKGDVTNLAWEGDFDTVYSVQMNSEFKAKDKIHTLKQTVSGRYLGDCPENQVSGQKTLSTGLVLIPPEKRPKPPLFDQWLQSAEKGDPEAAYQLGRVFLYAQGFKQNLKRAIDFFSQAANSGHSEAQLELAIAYDYGHSVEKNPVKAFSLILQAAELGNKSAMQKISTRYALGEGVDANPIKSFEWKLRLANLNDPFAQLSVGNSYRNGYGVEKDLSLARLWYQKAAEQTQDIEISKRANNAIKQLEK
jgi:hypothetical protein